MKLFPVGLYRVHGLSMSPALEPGMVVLGWRWNRPKLGQVVVYRGEILIVKRITKISRQGIWLEGDNSDQSTDSRTYGWLDPSRVEAVVWPAGQTSLYYT